MCVGGGGILKNLLQNCLAQVLELWYVTLPGGPLPSLFKSFEWTWQRTTSFEMKAPGSKMALHQEVLCYKKKVKKSSSSEPVGSGA